MKKEVLSQFTNPDLILLSFLMFFFCFIGVLVWVMLKSNKSYFKKMSMMPFGDEKRLGEKI